MKAVPTSTYGVKEQNFNRQRRKPESTNVSNSTVQDNWKIDRFLQNAKNKEQLLSATNKDGETALHATVRSESTSIVRKLVQEGAKVDARDNDGCTNKYRIDFSDPENFIRAAELGNDRNVDRFLQNAKNKEQLLSATNKNGETALHAAVRSESTSIVRKLIQEGAKVDARDNDGCTPIYRAFELGNRKIVKILAENKARIDWTGNEGKALLESVLESEDPRIISFFF